MGNGQNTVWQEGQDGPSSGVWIDSPDADGNNVFIVDVQNACTTSFINVGSGDNQLVFADVDATPPTASGDNPTSYSLPGGGTLQYTTALTGQPDMSCLDDGTTNTLTLDNGGAVYGGAIPAGTNVIIENCTCLDVLGLYLQLGQVDLVDGSIVDSVGTGSITAAAITLQSGSVSMQPLRASDDGRHVCRAEPATYNLTSVAIVAGTLAANASALGQTPITFQATGTFQALGDFPQSACADHRHARRRQPDGDH